MRKTTVLLADDHQIFLAGLQRLLEEEFEVVGAVGDGRELREAAVRLKPDVIVADISMPLLNGIDAVRSLPADGCTSKMIFLSMHGDALYRSEAMRAGASRYILKRDAPDKLVAAIHETAHGQAGAGLDPESAETAQPAETKGITPRQREIWQLLAEGRAPKEIATIAGLSVRTVEFHKYRLMQRLKVRTGAELTVLAVKHGLVH